MPALYLHSYTSCITQTSTTLPPGPTPKKQLNHVWIPSNTQAAAWAFSHPPPRNGSCTARRGEWGDRQRAGSTFIENLNSVWLNTAYNLALLLVMRLILIKTKLKMQRTITESSAGQQSSVYQEWNCDFKDPERA